MSPQPEASDWSSAYRGWALIGRWRRFEPHCQIGGQISIGSFANHPGSDQQGKIEIAAPEAMTTLSKVRIGNAARH